jgi:hypothetical protein
MWFAARTRARKISNVLDASRDDFTFRERVARGRRSRPAGRSNDRHGSADSGRRLVPMRGLSEDGVAVS